MARKKTDAEIVAENNRILDALEKLDPDDPSLAPFKTQNWIRKGRGMLAGLTPIAVVVLLALGGCAEGWLESFAPSNGPHSTTFVNGRSVTTYHYGAPQDHRSSVEIYRPDIWNRMFNRESSR